MSDFFNLKDCELAEEVINSLSFLFNTVNVVGFFCELLHARQSLKSDLEKVDLYFTG